MDVEPAAGMEQVTGVAQEVVAGCVGNGTKDLDFTWGQKVDTGNTLVANGNLTLEGVGVKALEARAVVEKGFVRCANG